jgi:hypothetical protein
MSEKFLQATHEGEISISGKILPCAVLENGESVIIQKFVFEAFERPARGQRARDKEINLPSFIAANNLLPYINEDVREVITPIRYKDKHGKIKSGYKAEILPAMCDVYLSARKDGVLTKNQERLGEISEMIVRALSKLGIIALVHEATGFQNVRKKDALQKILDAFISKELAAWVKRFPDEFYDEMFKLKGWNWDSLKRPSVVGRYTNDLVYARLAPSLVEELKKKNPRNDKGVAKSKDHQWLTSDVGHPALSQHLHATIGFMKAASTWEQFLRMMNRAFPKKGETIDMFLDDID